MLSTDLKRPGTLWGILLCVGALLPAQPAKPLSPQLNESGQIVVDGRSTPYLIRHLPVSSFPDLPASVADLLNQRGCLIPQTYEAHQPENVIHAGFERAESLDWAVLCSAQGTVSLLVFFSLNRCSRLQLGHRPRVAAANPRSPDRPCAPPGKAGPRRLGRFGRRPQNHLPLLRKECLDCAGNAVATACCMNAMGAPSSPRFCFWG